jgi:hypothetical protein
MSSPTPQRLSSSSAPSAPLSDSFLDPSPLGTGTIMSPNSQDKVVSSNSLMTLYSALFSNPFLFLF